MVPEYEWVSKGWELADSIVINPHKTLFVPLDFSVLYVRDLERLRRVFTSCRSICAATPSRRKRTTWITASSSAADSARSKHG